jgi:hypothetical protein
MEVGMDTKDLKSPYKITNEKMKEITYDNEGRAIKVIPVSGKIIISFDLENSSFDYMDEMEKRIRRLFKKPTEEEIDAAKEKYLKNIILTNENGKWIIKLI